MFFKRMMNLFKPNYKKYGRCPQYFFQIKDNLHFSSNGRQSNLIKIKDNLNILANGREPHKKIM